MPSLSLITLPVLVMILLLVVAFAPISRSVYNNDDSVLYIRTQSLYPPYIDHEMSNRWYDFGGSTVVNNNLQVRLTPEFQARKGWLRSKTPFYADSWSIEFEYKIHGRSSLAGDGFAFWFTNERVEKSGWLLGGPEQWRGLVVAFDTYDNGRHGYYKPYVAALYNDGTRFYNKDTDGKELEVGGCQADIRNRDYGTRARVRFIKDKYLKIDLNTGGWDEWTTCVHVTNVTLFPMGFIAFTGETGGLMDNHDIISISTNQIIKDDTKSSTHRNPEQPEHYNKSFMESGTKGPSYLFMTMVIIFLGGLIYFGGKQMGLIGQTQRDLKHF